MSDDLFETQGDVYDKSALNPFIFGDESSDEEPTMAPAIVMDDMFSSSHQNQTLGVPPTDSLTGQLGRLMLGGATVGSIIGIRRGLKMTRGMTGRLRTHITMNMSGAEAGAVTGQLAATFLTMLLAKNIIGLVRGKDDDWNVAGGVAAAALLALPGMRQTRANKVQFVASVAGAFLLYSYVKSGMSDPRRTSVFHHVFEGFEKIKLGTLVRKFTSSDEDLHNLYDGADLQYQGELGDDSHTYDGDDYNSQVYTGARDEKKRWD